MTRWVRGSALKQEELSLDPQTPMLKSSSATNACDLSPGGQWPASLTEKMRLRFNERPCLKN